MARSQYDPFGERYWNLTGAQARLCAALPIELRRLRDVLDQASADTGLKVKRVGWEKLHVLSLLEVDLDNRSWVTVRRGARWADFFKEHGLEVTKDALITRQFVDDLNRRFPEPFV